MPVTQPAGAIVSIGSGTVSDAILSPDGQTLYAVRSGTIYAYSTISGLETGSWTIGQTLGGIDISADGRYIIATEQQAGPVSGSPFNTVADFYVYRLDVQTGSATTYTSHVAGAGHAQYHDVAYVGPSTVILTQHYYGSGHEPLTTLNLATGTFTATSQTFNMDGTLTASADESHVLLSPNNVSDAPLFMYTAGAGITASHQWYADNISGFNSGVQAINSSGTMVAEGVALAVYDGSLRLITKLSTRYPEFMNVAGLAFSPDGSKLYLVDRNAREVFVLSTSTWDVVGGYPVGSDVTTSGYKFGNALQVSADGSRLAVIGTVSLQIIDLNLAVSDAGTSAGNENLSGDGGRDYLFGFGGNDTIDGSLGGDVMYGGPGNDSFYVDSIDDQVIEYAGGGGRHRLQLPWGLYRPVGGRDARPNWFSHFRFR